MTIYILFTTLVTPWLDKYKMDHYSNKLAIREKDRVVGANPTSPTMDAFQIRKGTGRPTVLETDEVHL